MKFTKEDVLYLTGKKFSNGYRLLLQDNPFISRLNCILKLTQGKKVLHIGCCDHIPLITKKIENKTWLHGLLMDNCLFVAGVDTNADAVEYVKNNVVYSHSTCSSKKHCNVDNVFFADVTNAMPEELKNTVFDFAILGEVVEHVNDPVAFLSKIKRNLEKNVDKIIITVPSALSLMNFKKNHINEECINTDHRYWFTPYTIAKVCFEAGIYPEELLFCDAPNSLIYRIVRKLRLKKIQENFSRHSVLSEVLVIVGSFIKEN